MQVRREIARGRRRRRRPIGDVDARGAQAGEARARDPFVGVVERDDDPGDAGRDQRVGARRRVAVVGAGLERAVRGGAAGPVAGVAQRRDLGVRTGRERSGRALADDLAVAREHAADPGLGAVRRRAARASVERPCASASSSRTVPSRIRARGAAIATRRGNDDAERHAP